MGEEEQGSGASLPKGIRQGILPIEHWGGEEGGQEEGWVHVKLTGKQRPGLWKGSTIEVWARGPFFFGDAVLPDFPCTLFGKKVNPSTAFFKIRMCQGLPLLMPIAARPDDLMAFPRLSFFWRVAFDGQKLRLHPLGQPKFAAVLLLPSL